MSAFTSAVVIVAAPVQPKADYEFKNFHRALCERFGYSHDEVDWMRDQVSLIEWIAKQVQPKAEPWQPIETAPKDNKTWVLVCEYGFSYVAIFDKEGFCHTDERIGLDPTHWIPLPKPPTK